MKKLINSVNGDVIDTPAGGGAALRGRAQRARGAAVTVLAGGAATPRGRPYRTPSAAVTVPASRAAAHPARTVDHAQRPELTRSRSARVDIPALRWGR